MCGLPCGDVLWGSRHVVHRVRRGVLLWAQCSNLPAVSSGAPVLQPRCCTSPLPRGHDLARRWHNLPGILHGPAVLARWSWVLLVVPRRVAVPGEQCIASVVRGAGLVQRGGAGLLNLHRRERVPHQHGADRVRNGVLLYRANYRLHAVPRRVAVLKQCPRPSRLHGAAVLARWRDRLLILSRWVALPGEQCGAGVVRGAKLVQRWGACLHSLHCWK